jgi:hypothetical protein
MLERAEPLLHSTPLQHIRDRLAACPAGRAMTLSTVWDDMRYVAMFSNFKQKYDEASGTSLKDVPYRAVVAYVEDQADYLLEEHACIDVCDMLNEFFGILVERPESHKHISSVDVDALRAAYQGDVPYEAGRTFEMWKVLAPLYGF